MGLYPEPAACVRDTGRKETRCATCSPQARDLLAAGAGFCPPGKTEARCGLAPKKNRVHARLKCSHKPGARLAHRRCACVRDTGRKETRCATCSPQARAFSPPGKTGAVRGPAPGKNRVRARHGEEKDTVRELPGAAARIARRRRGLSPCLGKQKPGVGPAPGKNRGRARHGEERDTVRELPGAAARFAHRRCVTGRCRIRRDGSRRGLRR